MAELEQIVPTGAVLALLDRMRAGDTRALARAISVVEDGAEGAAELLAACAKHSGEALRIGVTGPPGAGKSSLVDQLARELRRQGRTVGIVAVDPTSPYTGGALLGDRIRMQGFAEDRGVYIRSMASRGAHGGLARMAAAVCCVMEAAGRDVLLIETMGVGQDEIEVVRLAEITLLVLVPGMGDDVQSLKAGVMEVADLFVINKADRGGAELVEAEILAMQSLSGEAEKPPIVQTEAISGKGVLELLAAVEHVRARRTVGVLSAGKLPPATPSFAINEQHSGLGQSKGGELRLDHLGIAVRSIAQARRFYETLGLTVAMLETVEHEQVHTAMLPFGETRLELLEPTTEQSTIGRFLAKRGEGLHHIALHCPDVDRLFEQLKANGLRLATDTVRVGAGGHRYFFVHPASTGGVLLELVGDGAAHSDHPDAVHEAASQ